MTAFPSRTDLVATENPLRMTPVESPTRSPILIVLLLGLPLLVGCGGTFPPAPPSELDGGVLATFVAVEDTFRVWATRPETVEQLIALDEGRSRANIPVAHLRRGPGPGDFNAPWSWHHDPAEVHMAEAAIEVCDARPLFVERHMSEWIGKLFCPWSARLVALQDLR